MENSAKALLIAGGMLIVILVISMLVLFRTQLAAYMQEKHEEKILAQTIEANNKFADYQDKDLRGNELISVLNRIIDYNNLQAGQYGYDRIEVEIDMIDAAEFWKSIKYNTSDTSIFNLNGNKITNRANDNSLKKITTLSAYLVSNSDIPRIDDNKLQRLSANINYIALTSKEETEINKATRAQKLTSILGYTVNSEGYTVKKSGKNEVHIQIDGKDSFILDKVKDATIKYYQLTQFKRVMFTCTSIEYNTKDNGRINSMKFKVKTENGKIVFN